MCVRRWGKGGLMTRQDERTDEKKEALNVLSHVPRFRGKLNWTSWKFPQQSEQGKREERGWETQCFSPPGRARSC